MTPEIISQLYARMQTQPRSLGELHHASAAAGSPWSEDQVALLLACLPDVEELDGRYSSVAREDTDPIARALVQVASPEPTPVAQLIRRMPRNLTVTPAALCEIARRHPKLELIGPNRIRRK